VSPRGQSYPASHGIPQPTGLLDAHCIQDLGQVPENLLHLIAVRIFGAIAGAMTEEVDRHHLKSLGQPREDFIPPGFHGTCKTVDHQEGFALPLNPDVKPKIVP